jgi:hypothetical protein
MPKSRDLTGQKFGRLTAIRLLGASRWEFVCECGKSHASDGYHVTSGKTVSCGCYGRERRREATRAASLLERFAAHVRPVDSGCWQWLGKSNAAGYGLITNIGGAGGPNRQAHRVAYELYIGDIPAGLYVCHKCDTPSCVNPLHLFTGTAKDNTQDAISKGRMAIGDKNPNATLTVAQAEAIRNGSENAAALAERYGVSKSTIYDIRSGRSWTQPRNEKP